jgi:hypothetical protein
MLDEIKEAGNSFFFTAFKWVAGVFAVGFLAKTIFGKSSSGADCPPQAMPEMTDSHKFLQPVATPKVLSPQTVQR